MRRARALDEFEVAEVEYERIRRMTEDVAQIARHTGYKVANIAKAKHHLFFATHLLDRHLPAYEARFDADPKIAAAWHRLRTGHATAEASHCCGTR